MNSPPDDIAFYRPLTQILEPLIPEILSGKHMLFTGYNPDTACPDFKHTLAGKLSKPAAHGETQNINPLSLPKDILEASSEVLKELLGVDWERSGGFLYPALNGFMDWHTNHDDPGYRIYLVWCEEARKSCFLYSPDAGKTVVESFEPQGWTVNVFELREVSNPLWHAVTSGGTNRISFGFRRKRKNASLTLMQGGGLFRGA